MLSENALARKIMQIFPDVSDVQFSHMDGTVALCVAGRWNVVRIDMHLLSLGDMSALDSLFHAVRATTLAAAHSAMRDIPKRKILRRKQVR